MFHEIYLGGEVEPCNINRSLWVSLSALNMNLKQETWNVTLLNEAAFTAFNFTAVIQDSTQRGLMGNCRSQSEPNRPACQSS